MAEAARVQPRQQGGSLDGFEDIMYGILLRLPPKSVVRCRAVCRSWLRLASDYIFLLDHRRRQPSLPLVSFILDDVGDPEVGQYRLDVLDLHANDNVLQTVLGFSSHFDWWMPHDRERRLALHGSCDGVLLLSTDNSLYLCNPTTRHWGGLPPLHRNNTIAGFYWHRISDDYRVLYFRRHEDGKYCYYVMEADTRKQRLVSRQESLIHSSWPAGCARRSPPVLLHGNLHWAPVSSRPESIAVFNTVAEEFWLMPSPAVYVNSLLISNVKLLIMEGVLALSCSCGETVGDHGPSRVDLWFLEDYKDHVWACKYRIELPVEDICRFIRFLDVRNAIVVSHEGDVLVDLWNRLLVYDREGNSVANLPLNCSLLEIGPHMLKRSLVPHASLGMNNHSPNKPAFLPLEFLAVGS
uniref:F-box domain containing protein n=1 Tax=Zea mays TaxID=4577 RepID=B6TYF0_MAIZE|nr:F-box domain containing protein [Zea mays]